VLSAAGNDATVVLATHQTEDVAALCERVVVVDGGQVRWDGTVQDLVATAQGRVWLADAPTPGAQSSWRTGTGRHRNVGTAAPPDAELVEPTVEDAYLLLLGDRAAAARAEVAA
jgi:ABC-2 type transport system ATP-binding protein